MAANRMHTHYINIAKLRSQVVILAILSAVLFPRIAAAHNGEQHVIGVVVKVSDASITVKTTAGKLIEVGFNAKTDIKAGDRIVIHAVEVKEKLFAHTVEIGTATPAKQAVKQ